MTRVAVEDAIKDPDTEVGVDATITNVITRLQAESSLQMQFPNKVDEMPITMVQTVQKTMEIQQLQCIDKMVDDPIVQIPQRQVVEKTVGSPQLQIVEQIVETPETTTIQDVRASERSDTAPVCQETQTEIGEVIEIEASIPAEALHGVGGFVFDAHGNRVANELGGRNCVTGEMWKDKLPSVSF